MAYVSVLARQLEELLKAKHWHCEVTRFTLRATEPAFEPVPRVWMAGKASEMKEGEVLQVRPNRIIVEDHTSLEELARLEAFGSQIGWDVQVSTMTRFIDLLWDARLAAKRARMDAELPELPYEELLVHHSVNTRHVEQRVKVSGATLTDTRLLDVALASSGSSLAIMADAGLGKTELLRWHEWRSAAMYEAADGRKSPMLPPIALRVPLRGLRSFSLGSVARQLTEPDPDSKLPPLPGILNGEVLLRLLRIGRLVLFLDGLDELAVPREALEDGLRSFRRATQEGGRIVFATRAGHFMSAASIREKFDEREIGQLLPMSPPEARTLLLNYGASSAEAENVLTNLGASPARGIPLFLLMALAAGLRDAMKPEVAESRTRVLLELLSLFCKRDEPRLGVSGEVQMEMLAYLAHWTSLQGDLPEDNALELLGIDPGDRAAAIIKNPHALLTRRLDGTVAFKYAQLYSIFLAQALFNDWKSLGFKSVLEDFRRARIEEATIEYLARLVDEERLRQAWHFPEAAQVRMQPLVRRNLLAMAIAKLNDVTIGERADVRGRVLARLLDTQDLSDCHFADITLERVDLTGWTLKRVHGRGGALLYCPNLEKAVTDKTLASFDTLEGSIQPAGPLESESILRGRDRLSKMLRPWHRRGAGTIIKSRDVASSPDYEGWTIARKCNFVTQEKRYGGGRKFWQLTQDGEKSLLAFVAAELRVASDREFSELLNNDEPLRTLLLELAA